MSLIKNFFSDLRQSLTENPFISDKNIGYAVGEFLKYALAPFFLSLTFGTLAILSSDLWSQIFMLAIREFMQLIGLTILLGAVVTIIGISFILYRFIIFTKAASWITKIISHSAFSMTAILLGVLWGILIPATIEASSHEEFLRFVLCFSFILLFAAVLFYSSSKIFQHGSRAEINKTFGKHTNKATLILGVLLIAISVKIFFFHNSWEKIVNEARCEVAHNFDTTP